MNEVFVDLLNRLYKVYFGTPQRALLFVCMLFAVVPIYLLSVRPLSPSIDRVLQLETELASVRADLKNAKELIEETTRDRGLNCTFTFKKLSFSETAAPEVMRTLDYAQYAISKDDHAYAERLLLDANALQPTRTAAYYLGILSFRTGNFSDAIKHWGQAVTLEPNKHTEDILFYMILAGHRDDDPESARRFMKQLLDLSENAP